MVQTSRKAAAPYNAAEPTHARKTIGRRRPKEDRETGSVISYESTGGALPRIGAVKIGSDWLVIMTTPTVSDRAFPATPVGSIESSTTDKNAGSSNQSASDRSRLGTAISRQTYHR